MSVTPTAIPASGSDVPGPYRILVTGSRTWDDPMAVALELGRVAVLAHGLGREVVVVHGACSRGADYLADDFARACGLKVEPHPADWSIGKSAGYRRNAEMVALGADVCLAWIKDGSRGATHCADLAEKAGIPTRRLTAGESAT